jgi:hypothetical protein
MICMPPVTPLSRPGHRAKSAIGPHGRLAYHEARLLADNPVEQDFLTG